MQVLITEDDPISSRILEVSLQKRGYDVVACPDGTTAWQILQQPNAPSLAILDSTMRGLNGLEVCREVRQHNLDIYILLLLPRQARKSDIDAGFEAGADEVVSKPFNANELCGRLDTRRGINEPQTPQMRIINKIHSVNNLDELLIELQEDLQYLFNVNQAILFTVDHKKRELLANWTLDSLENGIDIRVPISEPSITGYCGRYGKLLNIADAYDTDELYTISPRLTFDASWDLKTGFRTRQMLVAPILFERKYLMGVLMLLNRKHGNKFTPLEEKLAADIAEQLGIAMRNKLHKVNHHSISKYRYLLENKLLSQQELEAALAVAHRKGQDVETVLIDDHHVPKSEIGEALSRYFNCPFLDFDECDVMPEPSLIQGLSYDYLKANYWVPLRRDESTVDILIDDPHNQQKVEHIQLLMKGLSLRFFVGLRQDILQYLYSVKYGRNISVKHCARLEINPCYQQWHKLDKTSKPRVRYCQECSKNVYLARDDRELRQYAALGRCVAFEREERFLLGGVSEMIRVVPE